MYIDRIDPLSTRSHLESWVAKNLKPWEFEEPVITESHCKEASLIYGLFLNDVVPEVFLTKHKEVSFAVEREALSIVFLDIQDEYSSAELFKSTHLTQCPVLNIERDMAAKTSTNARSGVALSATLVHHFSGKDSEQKTLRRSVSLESSMVDITLNGREYISQNLYTLLGKAGQRVSINPPRCSDIVLRAGLFNPNFKVFETSTFSTNLGLTSNFVKRTLDINIEQLMNSIFAEMVLGGRIDSLKKIKDSIDKEPRVPAPTEK